MCLAYNIKRYHTLSLGLPCPERNKVAVNKESNP